MLGLQHSRPDPRKRTYVSPVRVVWQTTGTAAPEHSERLLPNPVHQFTLHGEPGCVLRHKGLPSGLVLDFGQELHGGVRIIVRETSERRAVRLRARFGESVSEAMAEPNQDHAIHDVIALVAWAGATEIGLTGFRFVRLDTVDEGTWVEILAVHAVFLYRDIEYKGAFRSSDERLNRIWQTGAYTVHLNMQDHIWDGIKRDRLVWMGDLHPEIMVISSVFGDHEIVPQSLDLVRNQTPLPQFMNGHFSYSLWWILIQRDWYLYQGNTDYLMQQRAYLLSLLALLRGYNANNLPGGFLDWPTSSYPDSVQSGLHAQMVLAFRAGAQLCQALGERKMRSACDAAAATWMEARLPHHGIKATAALMALAGMLPAEKANHEVLALASLRGISTFYGYYVLQARALARDYHGCLDVIRRFWGAMLDLGATTFWEDFSLEWTPNAARIDELVPPGKLDIHAGFGDYCYKGLRHSLCHGWASGPTAWLSEHVLGFVPLAPGCRELLVSPHLGDLEWAEGAFPTPYGTVHISHTRQANGTIATKVEAPPPIKVLVGEGPSHKTIPARWFRNSLLEEQG